MWWEGGKEPACEQEQLKLMLICLDTESPSLRTCILTFLCKKKNCLATLWKQAERTPALSGQLTQAVQGIWSVLCGCPTEAQGCKCCTMLVFAATPEHPSQGMRQVQTAPLKENPGVGSYSRL